MYKKLFESKKKKKKKKIGTLKLVDRFRLGRYSFITVVVQIFYFVNSSFFSFNFFQFFFLIFIFHYKNVLLFKGLCNKKPLVLVRVLVLVKALVFQTALDIIRDLQVIILVLVRVTIIPYIVIKVKEVARQILSYGDMA